MQEVILEKITRYAPAGICLVLVILAIILVANLRQMKKINKKLSYTLTKAEDYFRYILEEEEEEEKVQVKPQVEEMEGKVSKSAQKARDAALLQDVLMEYFP